ncbi:MAG: hypothetical protein WCG20_00305 [bacterium]
MELFEPFAHNENKLTRTNMPREVFGELIHHEDLHREFHALNYSKTCATPENCTYVITGTDILENETRARKAVLTISYHKGKTESRFEYVPEEDEQRLAA